MKKILILTVSIVVAIFFLGILFVISQNVLFKEPFVRVDQKILGLVPGIRTAELTDFFIFVTFLGNWQSVVFISLIALVLLLRRKQSFTAILYISTLITAEGAVFLMKHLIRRARPVQTLSLITADSFSFPSGHTVAATVIFGFFAYIMIKSSKHFLAKTLILSGSLFAVALIALSRIYLGVHYPNDVATSIILGCLILSIFITIAEINEQYGFFKQVKTKSFKELLLIPILLILFSFFLHTNFIKLNL